MFLNLFLPVGRQKSPLFFPGRFLFYYCYFLLDEEFKPQILLSPFEVGERQLSSKPQEELELLIAGSEKEELKVCASKLLMQIIKQELSFLSFPHPKVT